MILNLHHGSPSWRALLPFTSITNYTTASRYNNSEWSVVVHHKLYHHGSYLWWFTTNNHHNSHSPTSYQPFANTCQSLTNSQPSNNHWPIIQQLSTRAPNGLPETSGWLPSWTAQPCYQLCVSINGVPPKLAVSLLIMDIIGWLLVTTICGQSHSCSIIIVTLLIPDFNHYKPSVVTICKRLSYRCR